MGYGQILREIRTKKDITLRELALRSDIDVAYLSRVERESILPPQKEELLDAINEALELESKLAKELKDQSMLDNQMLPKDIAEKMKSMEGVPMLLRTVANKKLDGDQIKKLTNFINERY
jgi:transcriptional regulator with XRE-family HTH domain